MPPQPEQNNYSFIVEDGNKAMVCARGDEGRNVLLSLVRLSLVHFSTGSQLTDEAGRGQFGASGVVDTTKFLDTTQSALQDFDSGPLYNHASYSVNTLVLSDLVHGIFQDRLATHNKVLKQRVEEGVRTPQSVLEELSLQYQDRQLLASVAKRWFNHDGWVLTPLHSRKQRGKLGQDWRHLYPVNRNDRRLDATTRETLFDAVPKKAQAYGAKRAPLNYHKTHGYLNYKRPFLLGPGEVQDVFGYIDPDSQFVPVVTLDRPERRA